MQGTASPVIFSLLLKPQSILWQLGNQLKYGDLGRQDEGVCSCVERPSGGRGQTKVRSSSRAFLTWQTTSSQNLVYLDPLLCSLNCRADPVGWADVLPSQKTRACFQWLIDVLLSSL